MKSAIKSRKFVLITIGIFFFTFAQTSCEKEKDYRDKYTGNRDFEVEVNEVNTDSIGHYENYKYNFTGELQRHETNALLFIYGQSDSITLSVDETGMLSNFPTQYCSGQFIGADSLHLFLRWGGLGGYNQNIVNGKK
jgi:hypothetical protein